MGRLFVIGVVPCRGPGCETRGLSLKGDGFLPIGREEIGGARLYVRLGLGVVRMELWGYGDVFRLGEQI